MYFLFNLNEDYIDYIKVIEINVLQYFFLVYIAMTTFFSVLKGSNKNQISCLL